jgi:integrase
MPRQFSMTFVPARKGWLKNFKGKNYAVSCAQLGCAATKEASYVAANAWWAKKLADLEAQAPKGLPRSAEIIPALERYTGKTAETLASEGLLTTEALVELVGRSPGTIPDYLREAILGADKLQRLTDGTNSITGGIVVENERTISRQVQLWLETLGSSVKMGRMSAGRWDAYSRTIKHFVRWLSGENDIATVNGTKLEGFYSWAVLQVSEKKWKPATATGVFMTARQFIRWAAELGIIPLPGNIASKRFKFGLGASEIITFTKDEISTLLKNATDRTRLYLLLMLNTGMYQNDIAELAVSEVDWKQGRITRKRSKTRNRTDAPTITYKLWAETFALLKANRARQKVNNGNGGIRVLLTTDNKPLVFAEVVAGKHTSYDSIQSAYGRLSEKCKINKPLKCLRKSSATLLADKFGAGVALHFLAHAPKTVAEISYLRPDQTAFNAALEWLEKALSSP